MKQRNGSIPKSWQRIANTVTDQQYAQLEQNCEQPTTPPQVSDEDAWAWFEQQAKDGAKTTS